MLPSGDNWMGRAGKRKHGSVGGENLMASKRSQPSSPRNGESRSRGEERGGSNSRPPDNNSGGRQHELLVGEPESPARDRFVTGAQEDLMQMLEERASEKAIENQMKIIKMFTARLSSNNRPKISCGTNHMQPEEEIIQEESSVTALGRKVSQGPEVGKATFDPPNTLFISFSPESSPSQDLPPSGCITRSVAKARVSASASSTPLGSSPNENYTRETRSRTKAKDTVTAASASASPLGFTPGEDLTPTSAMNRSKVGNETTATIPFASVARPNAPSSKANHPSTPTTSSGPKGRKKEKAPKRAQLSATKADTSRETGELLKTARPAAAPMALPASQRTKKTLTTTEVAQLSTLHSSFDQSATSRFHRHQRKINGTGAMASQHASAVKERSLNDRVKSPTRSPPEVVGGTGAGGGVRLDAAALRAVSVASAPATASPFPAWVTSATTATRAASPLVTLNGQRDGQPLQWARPGQVFNQILQRWIYVEEDDSDA